MTGTNTTLTVAASDDAGEAGLTYTWSYTGGSAASPVSFSQNGTNAAKATTATFTAAGAYGFTVTVQDAGGLTTTSSVNVTVGQSASVTVAPGTATLGKGDALLFLATVKDQFGAALSSQPAVTWTANGGGSIAADGTFSASSVGGPFGVTATSGTLVGTATVTITGETFTRWQTTHFTAEEIANGDADFLADADGDGLTNFLEYGLGTGPRISTALPTATLDANGHLTLILTRPKALPGVQYSGEATSSLASFSTVVPIEILTTNDPETIRVTDLLGGVDNPRRFLRVRVTQTTPP